MRATTKFRTRLLTAVLGGAFALSTLGMAAPAQATAAQVAEQKVSTLTDANVQDIKDLLSKFLVPEEQQKELIKKAKKGAKWDVYDSAKSPTTVEHDQVIGGMNYTIKRYADGSLAAQGVEVPQVLDSNVLDPNQPVPMSISRCTVTTGSGYAAYRGCQIDGVWGTVLVGAYALNFTIVNGGFDSIGSGGAGFQKCIAPTSCSTPTRVLHSAQEGVLAAYSRWQGDVSAPWASWNVWVQLNVGGNSYWQTNS